MCFVFCDRLICLSMCVVFIWFRLRFRNMIDLVFCLFDIWLLYISRFLICVFVMMMLLLLVIKFEVECVSVNIFEVVVVFDSVDIFLFVRLYLFVVDVMMVS